MIDRDRLWSHKETAAFLGISPATLYQLNWKGQGPRSGRIGKYRRYHPADVVSWFEDRIRTAQVGK